MIDTNSSGSLPDGCKTIRSTDTVLAKFFFVWDNGRSTL